MDDELLDDEQVSEEISEDENEKNVEKNVEKVLELPLPIVEKEPVVVEKEPVVVKDVPIVVKDVPIVEKEHILEKSVEQSVNIKPFSFKTSGPSFNLSVNFVDTTTIPVVVKKDIPVRPPQQFAPQNMPQQFALQNMPQQFAPQNAIPPANFVPRPTSIRPAGPMTRLPQVVQTQFQQPGFRPPATQEQQLLNRIESMNASVKSESELKDRKFIEYIKTSLISKRVLTLFDVNQFHENIYGQAFIVAENEPKPEVPKALPVPQPRQVQRAPVPAPPVLNAEEKARLDREKNQGKGHPQIQTHKTNHKTHDHKKKK